MMGAPSIPIIQPIPCLRDNYAYLIRDPEGDDAWLVDPSEVGPPRRALEAAGASLRGILATHHHPDHVGGIAALVAAQEAQGGSRPWVAGHASDRGRIPAQDRFIAAPVGRFVSSGLEVAGRPVLAMAIPGHTRGAIAWYLPPAEGEPAGDLFTGDTLFAAGCGRLFEGTPAEMHRSLQDLTALPPATRLWFGHEYTAANLRFAQTVEPDNPAIAARLASLPPRTTPTTVADELATNPFVRATTVHDLATRRTAKDNF